MRSRRRYTVVFLGSFVALIFIYATVAKLKPTESTKNKAPDKQGSNSLEGDDADVDGVSGWYSGSKHHQNPSQSLKTIDQVSERLSQVSLVKAPQETEQTSNQHFIDYVNSPYEVQPFDFTKCRMSNCFDFSRCQAEGPLKVHIFQNTKGPSRDYNSTSGESNIIHKNILKIIRNSKHYEADPKKSCLFVPEADTLDRDPLSQSFRPDLSNVFGKDNPYGINYLLFNLYSGSWPDYKTNDFAGLQIGAAMLAKASNSVSHHRPGFDISLPLFSHLHPTSNIERASNYSDNSIGAQNERAKTLFLSFKGKRYVFGSGSETRNSLYHLNNQRDIVMLTTCRHGKKWRESSDSRCSDDDSNYDQHDFVDLMKDSTFCLTPRGRRLGSFRYLEALSFDCIPVILSDGWVKPFDELVDWSCASVQFDEALLLQMPDMLRDIDAQKVARMKRSCRALYERYFSSVENIILNTLGIIERRVKNRLGDSFGIKNW